ncbi:MAG TPA: DUF262 domain-containing protein, partial [Pirellulaceae bacterium]|nr:DUF262 domain-containing protein [Pirellulaceae bacterium]
MFDTTKEDLKDILKKVDSGRLQLPDFQRDYVWGDDDVRSLIASIAKGFPVGALLTLETGGIVRFKPRTLAGVEGSSATADELLMDGQQRMTSLYQAMYCKRPIRTRTKKKVEVDRFYYFDMKRAVAASADIEDAIVGVPADKIVRSDFGRKVEQDLSTPGFEYEHDLFPINQIFDATEWQFGWKGYWHTRGRDLFAIESPFFKGIVQNVQHYKMPIIRLDKTNSREAICLVFEKVNVGGKKLDAFELLTAIFAASSFDLREDWSGSPAHRTQGRAQRMVGKDNPRRVLSRMESTEFLQACTILHTRKKRLEKASGGAKDSELPQISCKREALLGLPLEGYRAHADSVEAGFVEAASFLNERKVLAARDLPYPPQRVALAAAFSILGPKGQTAPARDKLARWFWSVSLGEQYGSSTESKIARDVPELCAWIQDGGPTPRSIEEAIFQQDRLEALTKPIGTVFAPRSKIVLSGGFDDGERNDAAGVLRVGQSSPPARG